MCSRPDSRPGDIVLAFSLDLELGQKSMHTRTLTNGGEVGQLLVCFNIFLYIFLFFLFPLSHLPTQLKTIPEMNNEQDDSSIKELDEIETNSQLTIKTASTTRAHKNPETNVVTSKGKIDNNLDQDEDEIENDFDSFILNNFIQFAGDQDVCLWLDETVKKFNRLCNSKKLTLYSNSIIS